MPTYTLSTGATTALTPQPPLNRGWISRATLVLTEAVMRLEHEGRQTPQHEVVALERRTARLDAVVRRREEQRRRYDRV